MGAVLVLLLHVVLVWVLIRTPFGELLAPASAGAAPLTIIELQPLREVDASPAALQVSLVVPRLQISAPEVQDIPIEQPEPPEASAGVNGEPEDSASPSGGARGRLLLARVAPQYPIDARGRGQEGTTQAMMRIDEEGRVVEVKVTASSGSRRLDDAAVTAFKKWKFASVPKGTAPEGSWIQTSHRFLLTHIKYSLLEDAAAEDIRVSEANTPNTAPAESGQALRRFLDDVARNRLNDLSDRARAQLAKMRTVLQQWGVVKSVDLISTAGPAEWTAYQVAEDANAGISRVDCKWAVLEVRHENARTVWMIALDRNGMVWSARAGPAS